jgi:hypothetical protein
VNDRIAREIERLHELGLVAGRAAPAPGAVEAAE